MKLLAFILFSSFQVSSAFAADSLVCHFGAHDGLLTIEDINQPQVTWISENVLDSEPASVERVTTYLVNEDKISIIYTARQSFEGGDGMYKISIAVKKIKGTPNQYAGSLNVVFPEIGRYSGVTKCEVN